MKRLISTLIAVILLSMTVLGTVSCSKEECTAHVDGEGDGLCDACGERVEKTESGEENKNPSANKPGNNQSSGFTPDEQKDILADVVINQLESAASAKVDFNLHITERTKVADEYSEALFDSDYTYEESLIDCSVTVSKTAEAVNASVYAKIQKKNTSDGEYKPYFDGMLMYLVDDVLYARKIEHEIYYQKEVNTLPENELIEAIRSLFGDTEAPAAEDIEKLKDALEEMFLEAFRREGNVADLEIAGTEPLTDLLTYLKGIDLETKTVGDVIDDWLSEFGEGESLSDYLEGFYELLPLTSNEAVKRIDEWLTANEGKTAQGLIDEIFKDERVLVIIENLLKYEQRSEEEIEKAIEWLKSFDLRAEIEEREAGEDAFAALLLDIVLEYFPPEAAPLNAVESEEFLAEEAVRLVKAAIEERLSVPVKDIILFAFDVTEEKLDLYKSIIDKTELSEANADIKVTFFSGYNLSHIEIDAECDFVTGTPVTEGGVTRTEYVSISAEGYFKIHSLSLTPVEIVPDKDFII